MSLQRITGWLVPHEDRFYDSVSLTARSLARFARDRQTAPMVQQLEVLKDSCDAVAETLMSVAVKHA